MNAAVAACAPAGALDWAGRSHRGSVRAVNQDRFVGRPDVGLFAVADGMGGHSLGEEASARVVEALEAVPPLASGHDLVESIRCALQSANADMIARAADLGRGGVVGSTVVVLVIREGHCGWLWAGDSRGYRLRDGALRRLTRDHSVVQALIDAGQIDETGSRRHAHRNIVTRALGASHRLALDVVYAPFEPGDTFLLCSDGLWDPLDETQIIEALNGACLERAADALIAAALARGADDNVTAVVVRPSG